MLKYKVNTTSELNKEDKIEMVNKADVGELLSVIRDFEESPSSYDMDIIKAVSSACFNKGLMLM